MFVFPCVRCHRIQPQDQLCCQTRGSPFRCLGTDFFGLRPEPQRWASQRAETPMSPVAAAKPKQPKQLRGQADKAVSV